MVPGYTGYFHVYKSITKMYLYVFRMPDLASYIVIKGFKCRHVPSRHLAWPYNVRISGYPKTRKVKDNMWV